MAARWFRVAMDPLNLKVVTRAADTLGVPRAQALGHLTALWSWLAARGDDGSVAGVPDDQLEEAVGWVGPRGAFALFVRNRHVDKQGRVRDWDEFMGPLVKARESARVRMASHRRALRETTDEAVDERLGRIPKQPDDADCAYCHAEPANCWDHVVPLSRGGRHEKRNIVPACRDCNLIKSNSPVTAMLARCGLKTEEQQNLWAERYGVFYALDMTRRGFPKPAASGNGPGNNGQNRTSHLFGEQSKGSEDKYQSSSVQSTEVELRKSVRTTGMYLSRELDLVSSESLDERALKSFKAGSLKHPGLDASQVQGLQGIELVRAFCSRFYAGRLPEMLDVLQRLRAVLRPAGIRFQGETVRATPLLLVRAMNETLAHPPSIDGAAVVFVLRKLQSGHLHETRTADGALVTEALAEQAKAESRDATAALLAAAPELFGGVKSLPTDPRKAALARGATYVRPTEVPPETS
jgi:5-methylcytosine-specific restriction endonuclease McrA